MRLVNIEDKIKNLISDLEPFGFEHIKISGDKCYHIRYYPPGNGDDPYGKTNFAIDISYSTEDNRIYAVDCFCFMEAHESDLERVIEGITKYSEDAANILLFNLDILQCLK